MNILYKKLKTTNNSILKFKSKKGRDSMFKCSVCGKFLPYDIETINIDGYIVSKFNVCEEQWYPEEVVVMTHKKCMTENK